ncbi:hypothetical protein [Nocardioides plantarum]|uniref:Uncharacterized protein n=1 Tax=Nocardioides plantarum TaxID=29299 RepID=A0ABV5KA51_9ACTN|nr:hypothetical protein [Nocardioides plantarum]
MTVLAFLITAAPEDKDVVAGWTAFAIFGLLALAVAILGFSLTKRLKNVEKAAAAGLYDPSDPKSSDGRPLRGLALARHQREQAAAAEARDS